MIDGGKRNVVGILIDAVDYEAAAARVLAAAREQRPYGVSALAVHGVMEGVADPELRHRLNHLDLVTPDGQAVRWGLNALHRTRLGDRCYGPTLMLHVCEGAAAEGLPIYLYGSRPEVLEPLAGNLEARFPGLVVAGSSPSRFGQVTPEELDEIADGVRATGARIVFAGLGCPRQEIFAYEFRDRVRLPVLAVGAAFDYHAGLLVEPPMWVQNRGLQWAWRLKEEPRRLWKRYASTNPQYLARLALQKAGLHRPDPAATVEPSHEACYA